MSRFPKQPKGLKPFSWSKLSAPLQTGTRPKTHVYTWAEKRENSFSSSEDELDIGVSARQRELLKHSGHNFEKQAPENHSKLNEIERGKVWPKSARQRELIRAGSIPSLPSSPKDQPSSALQKKWPSTARQRLKKEVSSSNWIGSAGSSGSRETGVQEINRDSAGSTRQTENRADIFLEAVRFGRVRHIELLIDGGADPNIADYEGVTPLIAAVADVTDVGQKERLMQLLLDSGADPNIGDNDGTTPLMHAATNNCYEAAVILLQHETTDPGQQNNDGNSALMYAASSGNSHIILLILAAFRKVHHLTYLGQQNCQGLTAFDLAEQSGHSDIANLLRASNQCAPRPKGIFGCVPAVHELSRSPTPTDSLEFREPEGDVEDKLNYCSICPPSPATDLENFDSLSLSFDRGTAWVLNEVNTRKVSTSPGSGNEADTESLMDGDHNVLKERERHLRSKSEVSMSSPAVKNPPSTSMSSSEANSPQHIKIFSASGNLHVDRNAIEKLKDISYSVQKGKKEETQSIGTINSHNLNPLIKLGIASQSHGIPVVISEAMTKFDHVGSNKSLNRSIQSLVHEDYELRPGHRPPTPARPSLPTLRPGKNDSSQESCVSSSSSEKICRSRRVTVSGFPRASSEPKALSLSPPQRSIRDDEEFSTDMLNASTKSEGWDTLWGSRTRSSVLHSEGHVVPLPPIGYTGTSTKLTNPKIIGLSDGDESVLNVAKKTLDKLDNVLSPEDKSKRKQGKCLPRSRTIHQMTSS